MQNDIDNTLNNQDLDKLLIYYNHCDQYGNVDIDAAKKWAKDTQGIKLYDVSFKMTNDHLKKLYDAGLITNIGEMLESIYLKYWR